MLTIEVLRGIPASGKSTYGRQKCLSTPNWVRVNNDDLRAMQACKWSKEGEKLTSELRRMAIKAALLAGNNVIVDNVNAAEHHWREVAKIAQEVDMDVEVVEKTFTVQLSTALARNNLREGDARVPHDAIERFYKSFPWNTDMAGQPMPREGRREVFAASTKAAPPVYDPSLPNAIICDIDGTLCIVGDRSPYDSGKCAVDSPNKPVVDLLKHYVRTTMWVPIFVSGREDKYRTETAKQIRDYTGETGEMLYMRATGDFRKDSVVKQEIYEKHIKGKYNVCFVLDDRQQVVDMWRGLGLPTWQVNPGEF